MASSLYSLLIVLISFSTCLTESCKNPEVTSTYYTTQDATVVTYIAYITEFSLKCSSKVSNIPLYAELNGDILPVVHSNENNYQVSWTSEIAKASSGSHVINLYDEDGYGQLRKVLRNNEPISSVTPLTSVTINHPGTYKGPWVNSEFLAAVVAALVWYLAFSAKSKLLG